MDKKVERVISLYNKLTLGLSVNKAEAAREYHVDERTIQRDIDDIRAHFSNDPQLNREVLYDRGQRGYILVQNHETSLTNSEILTVCKILLESRCLVKEEMFPIIDKLLTCCVPDENLKKVSTLIANEKYHYLEPHHGRKYVNTMWDLGTAVFEKRLIRMRYKKLKEPDNISRLIQPVGIMFSEYYFYLCAYICADEDTPDVVKHPFPTIYRIDRIAAYELTNEHFHIPYADRFEEGEFRKRIQFMFGGELRTIRFLYKGLSIESVLDRFPTAEIIRHDENGYTVQAEVYGDGVDIWLRGQGNNIELI